MSGIPDKMPEGVSELVCHPGDTGGDARGLPGWGYCWDCELKALISMAAAERVSALGITLRG